MLHCLYLALTLCTAAPTFAVPAPPTDQQVAAAVKAYQSVPRGSARPDPRADEALQGLSVEEMSVPQLESLGIMLDLASPALRTRFRDRFRALSARPGPDGAVAAAQLPRLVQEPPEGAPEAAGDEFNRARADSIVAAVDHPGFAAAVKAGRATGVYFFFYFYAENERVVKAGAAKRLAALVDDSWPPAHIDDLLAFTQAVLSPDAGLDRAGVDRVRTVASRLAQQVIALPTTDEQTRDGLLEAVAAINSASARGELIDRPAPAMNFIWTSTAKGARTLADFKGRVVVLDFWATWCGPCVAAFPHMRDLQTRYRQSPVTLIGVTSLQGWVFDPKAQDPAKRRRTGLSQDDELALLAPWVNDMNMTWTVAVSREDVFNPDYGVRGLPTVVIIDAKGSVRHAGLSPSDPELEDKIDALLREAGAQVPARPDGAGR